MQIYYTVIHMKCSSNFLISLPRKLGYVKMSRSHSIITLNIDLSHVFNSNAFTNLLIKYNNQIWKSYLKYICYLQRSIDVFLSIWNQQGSGENWCWKLKSTDEKSKTLCIFKPYHFSHSCEEVSYNSTVPRNYWAKQRACSSLSVTSLGNGHGQCSFTTA